MGRKKVTPTKKKNNFNYRKMLTNALRILVKNPFKESNTNKKDIIGLQSNLCQNFPKIDY